MALVLIAVSAEGLEEYDQALKAYKRATEADDSLALAWQVRILFLTLKAPKTTIAEFANTVDPDEMAHK